MRAICRRYGVVPSLLVLVFSVPFTSGLTPSSLGAATSSVAWAAAAPASADPYSDPARWVCRADKYDLCDHDLDATVVQANGTTSVERWAPAANAPVDCFYVYPTASWDLAPNSDFKPGAYEENAATRIQAARLGSRCRVFAPVYRQVTVTYISQAYLSPTATSQQWLDTAYGDLVAAFRHYIAVDNGGRGFVLVGHSQGAAMLARLLESEVQTSPAIRAHLVSALLLGLRPIDLPDRSVTPTCTSTSQTGCLVAFSSFRSTSPPPSGSLFAQSDDQLLCTNPAAPGGGRTPLHSYFPTTAHQWLNNGTRITTPFVTLPGLVDGECVAQDGFAYLEITVNADPSDPRTDDIPGDFTPEWGLHLSDVQLVQGDLIDLIGHQTTAYQAGAR
jgi:hypothetical protein